MNCRIMTIVRKFQMPPAKQESAGEKTADSEGTDLEIPEINTNFIDNLFFDPSFQKRFDASFEKTDLAGLEGEEPSATGGAPDGQNLMDLDFSPKSDG